MDGMTVYATPEEEEAAAEAEQEKAEGERHRKLVDLARERFAAAEEAETELRRLAEDDLRFRAGEQWDRAVLQQRALDGRPALVVNKIPQHERQITNEQRQAKPAIQVSPVDGGADKETAEVMQGLIRHVEYASGADVSYDTALTSAVRGGFGYIRLVSEYESEGSFEQRLAIRRVRDPFSVYLDPSHQEPDASDAEWGFVVSDGASKEAFEARHPGVEPVVGGWGNNTSTNGYSCQEVEYFYRDRIEDELLRLQPVRMAMDPASGAPVPVPDGEPVDVLKSDADKQVERYAQHVVIQSRPTKRIVVRWAKIAGSKVVEETEFPSRYIPIVPVLGDELWVGGKRILEGIVRHAKDPQRMYNFWSTAITETIALAPKAPFIGAEGQFEGYEKDWREAATRNKAFLQYRPKSIGGVLAPPPQRNGFEAPIAGMTQAMMFAADDLKATTGIQDASLGQRSNETSGIAINQRRNQSQIATFHFPDNLARALRHLGRILVDAIPRVYSNARIIRILGEDAAEKMVGINGKTTENQERSFDLGVGRYDVTVSMGPSYASKRQEMVATLLEFIRVYPQAAAVIGDLLADGMDFPGAAKMAERLKKMLPPGMAEPDPKQKMDPAAMAHQLQQLGQMVEQLTEQLNAAQDTLEGKTLELQSAERKDLIARRVDLTKAFAAADPADGDARTLILAQMAIIEARLSNNFPAAPLSPGAPQ